MVQVRVAMLCEVPTKLQLSLKAYVVSKDNLNSLDQWHPAHHIVTEAVTGGEVQQTVLCSEDPAMGDAARGAAGVGASQATAPDLLGGVADFVFRGKKKPMNISRLPFYNSVKKDASNVGCWVGKLHVGKLHECWRHSLQADRREEVPLLVCARDMSASASLDPRSCEQLSQKCVVKAVLGTSYIWSSGRLDMT